MHYASLAISFTTPRPSFRIPNVQHHHLSPHVHNRCHIHSAQTNQNSPHNPLQARSQPSERRREECDPRRKREAHQPHQDRLLIRRQDGIINTYFCGSSLWGTRSFVEQMAWTITSCANLVFRGLEEPNRYTRPPASARSLSHLNKRKAVVSLPITCCALPQRRDGRMRILAASLPYSAWSEGSRCAPYSQ